MSQPLISVIIPCYNVEEYIDQCMESIVSQTIGLDSLEIILVNDASTDGTLTRLQQWEQKYPDNVMLISYDVNMRQGGARNIGIGYASGDFIGFVDADDWVEPEMYQELYQAAQEYGCDVATCKYQNQHIIQRNGLNPYPRKDYLYQFEKIDGVYYQDSYDTGCNGQSGSICCGLYRKSLIKDNELFFPEQITYEDNYWAAILRLFQKNLYIIDQVYYHYRLNPNSTVESSNSGHHLDRMKIEVAIVEEYRQRGVFELYYEILLKEFIVKYFLNTFYIVFTRFENIPINFMNMRETVLYYFPDCRARIVIEDYPQCEQTLLELLLGNYSVTQEDLELLKTLYLKQMSMG